MIAPNSTELCAAPGERGITDAKGPVAHCTATINVTHLRVSIRVAHRSGTSSRTKKYAHWTTFFLLQKAKERCPRIAPTQGQQGASASHPFNRSKSFPTNDRSVAAMQDTAKVQIAFALKRNSKLGRRRRSPSAASQKSDVGFQRECESQRYSSSLLPGGIGTMWLMVKSRPASRRPPLALQGGKASPRICFLPGSRCSWR
jgi:hypothetical protein